MDRQPARPAVPREGHKDPPLRADLPSPWEAGFQGDGTVHYFILNV